MRRFGRHLVGAVRALAYSLLWLASVSQFSLAQPARFRVATFNASLSRKQSGALIRSLQGTDRQAQRAAAIIQHVRPDILLLNEFDWDPHAAAAKLFVTTYLASGQFGQSAIAYPFQFTAPVNTGLPTGFDLDGNGRRNDPQDAHGFGAFRGQFGMLVLSRFPIEVSDVRTFQNFRWRDLPGVEWPTDPSTKRPYYSEAVAQVLRLSSKSHWDIPINVSGQRIHLLVSHPTPPVFDGPEDRNGRRNNDEIRFWSEYLRADENGTPKMQDDQHRRGQLDSSAHFVIAGDLNADPVDGDSRHSAIRELLAHPRVNGQQTPSSKGGVIYAAMQQGANVGQKGNPAYDTADFFDGPRGSGNLRVDYVLPSATLQATNAGVFWPTPEEAGADWISCSDHRLVWVDLQFVRRTDCQP